PYRRLVLLGRRPASTSSGLDGGNPSAEIPPRITCRQNRPQPLHEFRGEPAGDERESAEQGERPSVHGFSIPSRTRSGARSLVRELPPGCRVPSCTQSSRKSNALIKMLKPEGRESR